MRERQFTPVGPKVNGERAWEQGDERPWEQWAIGATVVEANVREGIRRGKVDQ
jgi:hypothetical protein